MKKILTLLLLGSFYLVTAQVNRPNQEGDTLYFDKWYRRVAKEVSSQYALIEKIQMQQKPRGYWLAFYQQDSTTQKAIKTEVVFSTMLRWLRREGQHTYFWENGNKKEQGLRKRGKRIGIWKQWYKDGTMHTEYEYFDTKPGTNGTLSRLVNFWNPSGELLVENGNGNYEFTKDNGETVKGQYVNYNKEGAWEGFRKDSTKMYRDIYKEDVFQQGESWDEEGKRYTYTKISERGQYSEGRQGLVKLISENFKVPEFAKQMGIEGSTIISFEVSKEGKVENFKVVQGLCKPCDQEAMRVAKMLKKWEPGKLRGQIARFRYRLPFGIRLTSK